MDRPQVGQSRFQHRDQGARRCREAPPRSAPWDPGWDLASASVGLGRLVSAPASSFYTLPLTPCTPSLPPSATKCQHISLSVPLLLFPSPIGPSLPSLLSRSQLGKSFHLNPLLPALNVSPVSFPTGTCIVILIPNRSIWRQATLGDSDSLRVGGAGSG